MSLWISGCVFFAVIAAAQLLAARMSRKGFLLARAEDERRRLAEQESEVARQALQRAHVELDASERRYRGIFDSAAVALFELDLTSFVSWRETWRAEHPGADLTTLVDSDPALVDTIAKRIRVLDANDEALRLMELSDRALLRDSFFVLFEPDNRKAVVKLSTTLGRQPLLRHELTLRTFQGRARRVLLSARSPIEPAKVERLVISAIDVTEQRQLEERTRTAQRMEAIGRVAGGVAHDFNNALVVIMSWADLLRQPGRFEADREQGLDAISKSAARAAQLTRQLLSFGRREVRAPRPTALPPFVDETLRSIARVMPETIEVNVEHQTDLSVMVDEAQLEQVLLNLVFNARDAMPRGGHLDIRTTVAAFEDVQDLPTSARYLELRVTDTGIGMDANTKERIFDPFFTTKGQGKGTGLGLSTVHTIVAQSHGKVIVDSTPGHGTSFRVFLPVAAIKSPSSRPGEPSELPGRGRIVLLVEDETLVRDVMRQALVSAGYQVVEASDGKTALELARGQKLDLLCTDGALPGIGVKQLIDEFRRLFPRAPVIVCSGYVEEELVRQLIAQGDCTFISKPFTPEELLRKIAEQVATN